MDEISVALIHKALDGLSLRYQYTAQNIANANTPNYQAMAVTFEDSLAAASTLGAEDINAVQPQAIRSPYQASDGAMRLDMELASAAQTAMRYSALIEVIARQMSLSHAVVRGGQ